MLPANQNTSSTATQIDGLKPSQMWNKRLANFYTGAYLESDQAFIDEWKNAIDMFGMTFHYLTLVVATGESSVIPKP